MTDAQKRALQAQRLAFTKAQVRDTTVLKKYVKTLGSKHYA